jgi:hypothetical protein
MSNVVLSNIDYMNGVKKIKNLYNKIEMFLNSFNHRDHLNVTYNECGMYFKIFRKNSGIGFQVLVNPETQNYNIYYYKNNKKNITNMIEINSINEIKDNINKLLCDMVWKDKMNDIGEHLRYKYVNNSNINVITGNYGIYVIDITTNNGFYISYDSDKYAKVNTIINNCGFPSNIFADNLNSLINIIYEKIACNDHNITKFYNIVDPRYVDYNDNETVASTNTSENFQSFDVSNDDPESYE